MNRQDVIDFVNTHQACTLATVENGKPHARGMLMYRADEQGIVFHTGTFKSLYQQLQLCGDVELCFNDFEKGVQVRVSGTAGQLNDKDLLNEIVQARPFLQPYAEKADALIAVFRVRNCAYTVWNFALNNEQTIFNAL